MRAEPVPRRSAIAVALLFVAVGVGASASPSGAQTGEPSVSIETTTNGSDADTPPGPTVAVGDTVVWQYSVTNDGGVDLIDLRVADEQTGDVCTISLLAVDASTFCTQLGIAVGGQYRTVGSVVGMSAEDESVVADEDPSHYFGVVNTPPEVSAGLDASVVLPDQLTLVGTVTDDGLPDPPGAVTVEWTQVSGPGVATFDSPNALITGVGFSAAGDYVLRISADDGALTADDDVAIGVVEVAGNPPIVACPTDDTPYTDIAGSFAEGDITCIHGLGLTQGTTTTTYDPQGRVTRAQMAAFLARMWLARAGTCPEGSVPLTDIAGSFAEADITCIHGLGLTQGATATTYDPGATVTRQQMAAFTARAWTALGGVCPIEPTPLVDIAGSFAEADITCVHGLGIAEGLGEHRFAPLQPVSREQMAAVLARLWTAANEQLLFP